MQNIACYHGGVFFSTIGERFDTPERSRHIKGSATNQRMLDILATVASINTFDPLSL